MAFADPQPDDADAVTLRLHGDSNGQTHATLENGLVRSALREVATCLKFQYLPKQHFRLKRIPADGHAPRIMNNSDFIRNTGLYPGDTLEVIWSGEKPVPGKANVNVDVLRQVVDESLIKDIHDYVIEVKPFDGGGFGSVHKGYQKSNPSVKLCFKKILNLSDWDTLKNLVRETRIMANVKYASVMPLLGIIIQDNPSAQTHDGLGPKDPDSRVYLIMPLMAGTMAKLIPKTPSAEPKTKEEFTKIYMIMYGVACGMRELHRNGVLHRDLKLENVLLDENDEPYITDFGMSGVSAGIDQSQLMSIVGKKDYYVAPELRKEDGRYSGKADVWSFGIMLWCLLSNRRPYGLLDGGRQIGVAQIETPRYRDGPPLDKVIDGSDALKRLLKDCLQPVNDKRKSFDEIVRAMEQPDCYQGVDEAQFLAYKNRFEELQRSLSIVHTDKTRSRKLRMAMENGDAKSGIALGECYECGYESGITVDFSAAFQCYQKAASFGDATAYKHLARCYKFGIGVAKDEVLAEVLEEKAAAIIDATK